MDIKAYALDTLKSIVNISVLWIGVLPVAILLVVIGRLTHQLHNDSTLPALWFRWLTAIAGIGYAFFIMYCDSKKKFRVWK